MKTSISRQNICFHTLTKYLKVNIVPKIHPFVATPVHVQWKMNFSSPVTPCMAHATQ